MKTRLSLALAFLLMVVQGLWAQTPMTPAGENTWTAPMPAYQILLHADYWGEFAISYELNGGVNHEENPVKYYEDQEITLKAPVKEDYIFLGWTGSNGVTPQESVTIAKGSSGDKNYVANWKLDPEVAKLQILTELYNAIGDDVWTGYGVNTGVISYSRGGAEAFHASFMGGNYAFDLPFAAFTEASKAANTDGSYTYTLTCNLPAQTGMGQETLHVTLKNGEITELESENAGVEMNKEEEISGWVSLQNAFAQGGVIKLAADVTDLNSEGALVVPAGKTVMLELNGHTINRDLAEAVADGSVIINNGTLAVMDTLGGKIIGGKTTGNGGGILNNGVLTLYGGEITGNVAALGGGVYNNGGEQGFWMTGGLIKGNTATTHPAIGGEVIFNAQAVVQINADGDKVSIAQALASMSTLAYVQPAMPNYDDLQPADPEALKNELLQELWTALGENVWTGYGVNTGVISYSRGGAEAFHASFMGGNYAFDLPFAAFTEASKAANTDGSYTYTLTCNLPAQTGMGQETLHVTLKNGEITELESENAGVEMNKEEEISGWVSLQNAFAQGGVIKLAADVTDLNSEGALVVPAGKTVMLELNGHTINRNLEEAVENGSVIINNGTLAVMDTLDGKIIGGNTTGNGGGILNNGTLTLYGGEITGNVAALGGGVYNRVENTETVGFWMTGGLIKGNTATTHPAIGGEVIFNAQAVVQINADGDKVSIAQALASMSTLAYVQPAMPNYDDLQPADPEALKNELLQELWTALGENVWTGYGVNTGVISYSRGGAEAFHASFMGGNYAFDLPFAAFTEASKAANTDGSYTYTLTCNLPAQTGMGQETLHVTLKNGEITELESENAGVEMNKEEEISGWVSLQNAFTQGGVIKLAADVADLNSEGALVVPAGKTVMLELNGHTINRDLAEAVADGSVIINNGTLAVMDTLGGKIIGGNTTGNGGGILNNGTLTLYGGEITGNVAALGGGVYNNGGEQGFWMTGGLIKGNTATTHPAIGGEVIFNTQAVVQINADGDKVSIAQALASMSTLAYVQPAMPNYDDLQPANPEALKNELLQELWTALGENVWTGYGVNTGVISYSRGGAEAFHASFMGGNYAFDLPFAAFTEASKAANTDGSYTYTLTCNLPAQTGMGQETLHVTLKNGEITELESENAGVEMNKEEGPVTGWAALQAAINNGGVIKLADNVTAESTDAALTIPADKTVVLELGGFTINRNLAEAVENGSVIINNGTLAVMDTLGGKIIGGNTIGNGGGILNNGVLTLYGGEITGNVAALGGGVYNTVTNTATEGFWMTGGLIHGNTATNYSAIKGDVTFNDWAAIQVNAEGKTVTIAEALANMENYDYVKPVMPSYEDIPVPDPETPTSVEDVQGDNTQATKFIENGVLYIKYNGTMYNVQGLRVK